MGVGSGVLNLNKHIKIKENYNLYASEVSETNFEEYVIESEVVQNLKNAIDKLPEQRKLVIHLYLQGFKNEEIADNMNISVNTVKQQKKIAYNQLRQKLSVRAPLKTSTSL